MTAEERQELIHTRAMQRPTARPRSVTHPASGQLDDYQEAAAVGLAAARAALTERTAR
jgi:hypothetical protein